MHERKQPKTALESAQHGLEIIFSHIGDVFVSLFQGHELLSLFLIITWYQYDVHCLKRDRKDTK